jgi:hypothetical protein
MLEQRDLHRLDLHLLGTEALPQPLQEGRCLRREALAESGGADAHLPPLEHLRQSIQRDLGLL